MPNFNVTVGEKKFRVTAESSEQLPEIVDTLMRQQSPGQADQRTKTLTGKLAFPQGIERVRREQEERPGIFEGFLNAANSFSSRTLPNTVLGYGDVLPGLVNLKPDKEFSGDPKLGIKPRETLGEDLKTAFDLATFAPRSVISGLSILGTEAQAEKGNILKGAIDATTGKRTGQFEDLIRSFLPDQTANKKSVKFATAAVGLLAEIPIGFGILKGAGGGVTKARGNNFLLEKAKQIGKVTDDIDSLLFKKMDDFFTKADLPVDGADVASLLEGAPQKLSRAMNLKLGNNFQVKSLKDIWKVKKAVGREMKNVWRKSARGEALNAVDEQMEQIYFGLDDLITSNIPDKAVRSELRALNKSVSQSIKDNSIVKGIVTDKSGRPEDTSAIKSIFVSKEATTKQRYFDRLKSLDDNISGVIKDLNKFARSERLGRYLKGVTRTAAGVGVGGSLLGRFIRNKGGDFVEGQSV